MRKIIPTIVKSAVLLVATLLPLMSALADNFLSNDANIDFEIAGTGEPVFILHGGLASREDLRGLINHLSKNYKVVALDSRGHGKSSDSEQQISYRLMASDVYNLAAHLGLKSITIIGQSDGSITALTAALQHADIVSRLVLLSPNFSHTVLPEASKRFLKNFKAPKTFDRSRFPGMYLHDFLAGGRKLENYQTWFDNKAIMWTTSPNYTVTDLAKIRVPALVINGDRDDMPLDHIFALYSALPSAQLFIVPGATHFLQHEKPEILHRMISEFLAP